MGGPSASSPRCTIALARGCSACSSWAASRRRPTAIERMQQDAERTRLPDRQWRALVHRAGLAILNGRFGEGGRLAAEALAVRRDASDPTAVRLFTLQTYLCRHETGRAGRPGGIDPRAGRGVPRARRSSRCLLAALLARPGRPEEARRCSTRWRPTTSAALRRTSTIPRRWRCWRWSRRRSGTPLAHRPSIGCSCRSRSATSSSRSTRPVRSARRIAISASSRRPKETPTRAAHALRGGPRANARLGARPALARTQYEYARLLLGRDAPGDRARARRPARRGARARRRLRHGPTRRRPRRRWSRRAGEGARASARSESAPAAPGPGRAAARRRFLDDRLRPGDLPAEGHEGSRLPPHPAAAPGPGVPCPRSRVGRG